MTAHRQPVGLLRAPLTTGLSLACVGMHLLAMALSLGGDDPTTGLWTATPSGQALVTLGGLSAGHVWVDGQWWRLATTFFLHGSGLHLLFNMWSLAVVGPITERAFGRVAFLALVVGSSVAGAASSLAVAEAPLVVGASAGVLGIAGALVVGRWFGGEDVSRHLQPISVSGLVLSIIALLVVGSFVPVVAQAGHVGGLVAGALLGLAFGRGPGRALERMAWTLAAASYLLAASWLAGAPTGQALYHEAVANRALATGDLGLARAGFTRALQLRPDDARLKNGIAYALALAEEDLLEALHLVEEALEEEPSNADYLDTRGWLRCLLGDSEAGIADLKRASVLTEGSVPEIEGHVRDCATASVSRETSADSP